MVCFLCSNCLSKTPSVEITSSDDEPRGTIVQLASSKKRLKIPEDAPTEDDFDDIVLEHPIGNSSKKRLQLRDFNRSQPANRLHPVVSIKPNDDHRKQTVFSDWGDVYDGFDSMRLSNPIRSVQRSADFSFFSEVGPRTSNVPTFAGTTKMDLPAGSVLVMQLTKENPRFRLINLESTLNEVVDNFLSSNSGGVSLPVSFTESENLRPKLMKANRMAMTIRDNLGRNLDVLKQGLTFSVGPVNSKLCYKMIVVDLGQMQKIYSLTHGGTCEGLIETEL